MDENSPDSVGVVMQKELKAAKTTRRTTPKANPKVDPPKVDPPKTDPPKKGDGWLDVGKKGDKKGDKKKGDKVDIW